MATLTAKTWTGDGTIDAVIIESTTDTSFFDDCNQAPDGGSSSYISNDTSETTGYVNFTFDNMPSDFAHMDTLSVTLDGAAFNFSNDTCGIRCRIFTADNGGGSPLTDLCTQVIDHTDTTRAQNTIAFTGVVVGAGKSDWDNAYFRMGWIYSKIGSPDNGQIRIYGGELTGTYTVASPADESRNLPLLGVG